jgi:hypothetical protein
LLAHEHYFKVIPGVDESVQIAILKHIASRWKFVSADSMYAAFSLDPSKTIQAFAGDDLVVAINATTPRSPPLMYTSCSRRPGSN